MPTQEVGNAPALYADEEGDKGFTLYSDVGGSTGIALYADEGGRTGATKLMKGSSPADFNQAIMNFGALVCTPKNAQCDACPLSSKCYAYKNDRVDRLPVRTKRKTNTDRYFHFIVLSLKGKILMTRRGEKDIWRGLYTPLLIETKSTRKPSPKTILATIAEHTGTEKVRHLSSSDTTKQLLSHQTIHGRFHYYDILEKPRPSSKEFVWVSLKQLDDFPRPKMMVEGE